MENYEVQSKIIDDKVFKSFYYIIFIVFIITSITVFIITGFAIQSKVNSSNYVNSIPSILLNSYLLSGNCWSCNAQTQEFKFISKYVENDLTNTDTSTTGHFPTNRHNKLIIPNLAVFNNLQFLAPFDLSSPDPSQTTTLYFGNMSKIAAPGLSGLPPNSRSTLIINSFNGDTIPENSRCLSFTYSRIYIVYNYNNILNNTNYKLCICPSNRIGNIFLTEFCASFN